MAYLDPGLDYLDYQNLDLGLDLGLDLVSGLPGLTGLDSGPGLEPTWYLDYLD